MTNITPLNTPASRPGLIHGTCLLLGPRAVLLRGASGSGKSRLAGALLREASITGHFAGLVADDQVEARAINNRLILGAPPRLAGLREHAGIGILGEPHEGRAVAGLVVDLIANGEEIHRMPEGEQLAASIAGVRLARLALKADAPGTVAVILDAMARLALNRFRENTLSTIRVESLLHRAPQIFNDRNRG